MKLKDWNIIFETPGKQLNLIVVLGIISLIGYFITSDLEKMGYSSFTTSMLKGIMIFLAVYYLVYCLLLTKKIIEKYYK
jgi:hypothetical protein